MIFVKILPELTIISSIKKKSALHLFRHYKKLLFCLIDINLMVIISYVRDYNDNKAALKSQRCAH